MTTPKEKPDTLPVKLPKTRSLTKEQKDLRKELRRRKRFPATTDIWGYTIPQQTTVAVLEAELLRMPADYGDRRWYEYELALAREQARIAPGTPFVRSVPKKPESTT